MFNEKISIPLSILTLAVLFSFKNLAAFPKYLGFFALIVLASVFAKKITGYFVEVNARSEIWDFRRYWLLEYHKLSKPLPIGILLPLILYVFSYGTFKWLGILQTEFEAKVTKKIRKRKAWSFPELRELDVALICLASILSSLLIAFISFAFSKELALLSLLYAFFNILPIGKLDGIKLFFSSRNIYFATVLAIAGSAIILGLLHI